jgi:hypothetical protein
LGDAQFLLPVPLDLAIIGSVIGHQLMVSVDPAGICFADMDALRRTFCLGKRPINPDGVFCFFFSGDYFVNLYQSG